LSEDKITLGVFGGSGFYSLFSEAEERVIETPYGAPSNKVVVGVIDGKKVAFMPRHGANHQIPPHMINYRANLWAMKSLGVERLVAPCAAGSLKKEAAPGDFVICDQYIDRTSGRKDTFYDGPIATHVSAAEPYCPEMRDLAYKAGTVCKIKMHSEGTIVVIQGPRFSTRAESKWFSNQGWAVVNMTQYPEVHLARELSMCVVNISLVTDYDAGLSGEVEPVSHAQVVTVFNNNLDKLKNMLAHLIKTIPKERNCSCKDSLLHARF
jgi:5'-methylthioadenosine phosphorylase